MSREHRGTSTRERWRAWEREDPDELRRAAAEWRQLGFVAYADYLEAYARGERPEFVRRPL